MTLKIVKSVARVVEILELYNQVQRPLPAIEVAERLNYPLSSTHEILKTMVELGFFTYGDPKWTYAPAVRFSETVDWVRHLAVNSNVYTLMEALNQDTRETINLSQKVFSDIKILKRLECLYDIGVSSKPRIIMSAPLSLTGIVALAHFNDAQLKKFYTSLQNSETETYKQIDFDLISDIHDELRKWGWALRTDVNIYGIGTLCYPIISSAQETYVMGIVGPSERIRKNRDQLVQSIKVHTQRCGVRTKYPIRTS